MDEIDKREKERNVLTEELRSLHFKITKAESILTRLRTRRREKADKFMALDRELAMENRTILPSRKSATKTSKPKEFTVDEIKSIAIKLGVEITIKEENEK